VFLDPQMLSVIRSHHERYDGSGYPDGLKADDITIYAQIVSVADAYDAMTSSRSLPLRAYKRRGALQDKGRLRYPIQPCGRKHAARSIR